MRVSPKSRMNKTWTEEEKFRVIKPIINNAKGVREASRETSISSGMISNWIKFY